MVIHPLRPEDERAGFTSGNTTLDRYLAEFAWQGMRRHRTGVTYVADEAGVVLGYVTVAAGSISREGLPDAARRRLPAYPLPILRVARLAVDERVHGQGIGSQLLATALALALEMADTVGCVGLVVDAKPEAQAFYERLGFLPIDAVRGGQPIRPRPVPMFLPTGAIEAARGLCD